MDLSCIPILHCKGGKGDMLKYNRNVFSHKPIPGVKKENVCVCVEKAENCASNGFSQGQP